MATFTASTPATNGTDAEFRIWGKAFSDALAAAGFVKTADTGQVNWATVTKPSGAYADGGFEIWRFDDDLQATAPLFMRFGYGAANSQPYPAIKFQIGGGSNGAGTLTGNVSQNYEIKVLSSNSTLYDSYFSGAGGTRFTAFMFKGFTNYGLLFSIERTKNANGTNNSIGAAITIIASGVWNGSSEPLGLQTVYLNGAAETRQNRIMALYPIEGAGNVGNEVGVYPIFPVRGKILNPLENLAFGFRNLFTEGVNVSFNHYGAAKTFKPLWTGIPSSANLLSGRASEICALMRWE